MILSFHPCFEGDKNILCAGRDPGKTELSAIRAADAVVLPQGCKKPLYDMARANCPHVFPNYDARFRYPDKIGQIHLFRKTGVSHPATEVYTDVGAYFGHYGQLITKPSVGFPFIFKFNWGGEGDNVFLIRSFGELRNAIQKAVEFERTGQKGFLLQQYIPAGNRTLRVAVIGTQYISYWRVQEDTESFCANVAKGGSIALSDDRDLQKKAVEALKKFCGHTEISLAGFDFLFSAKDAAHIPLFLEINYFFGRHGLGGCEKYYEILVSEIEKWIGSLELS